MGLSRMNWMILGVVILMVMGGVLFFMHRWYKSKPKNKFQQQQEDELMELPDREEEFSVRRGQAKLDIQLGEVQRMQQQWMMEREQMHQQMQQVQMEHAKTYEQLKQLADVHKQTLQKMKAHGQELRTPQHSPSYSDFRRGGNNSTPGSPVFVARERAVAPKSAVKSKSAAAAPPLAFPDDTSSRA